MSEMEKAAAILRHAGRIMLFTGAGISVESGIPPFRGNGGLWEKVDPSFIEINHFLKYPEESWAKIRELFYDHWGQAEPNPAHIALAELQKAGKAGLLVTQNIDCLHQRAGSEQVVEIHGTLEYLVCCDCGTRMKAENDLTDHPVCPYCTGLLKPDVVFFGEDLPPDAVTLAFEEVKSADAVLVVGTSGEVMPACLIPRHAKRNGAKIIEVNFDPSAFTREGISDVFLQGKAGEILPQLVQQLVPTENTGAGK
ncbi:MAG: NAD-dependent deacylase [Lentisphaeria bacterium]|nr:NAD-dependent deacylase [Lentisphaeria bacterium]